MTSMLYLAMETLMQSAFAAVKEQEPPAGALVRPRVYIGDLPPKRNDRNRQDKTQGEDYPFVLILPTGGEDNESAAMRGEVEVTIVCGAYIPPDIEAREGVIGVQRLLDVARLALLGLPDHMLNGQFELRLPMRWRLGPSGQEPGLQPHPYYHGEIKTQWVMPPIAGLLCPEERIRIYGAGYESPV